MRNYLIEDLYPEQMELVRKRLDESGLAGSLEGIYYLPVPEDLLAEEQREHQGQCGPYIFVLEILDETSLKLELLVRAQGKLRCSCVMYATPAQRSHIMDFLDVFLRQLDISV
ncbi:MAG: hypothetical protein KKA55_03760 [Proteobacteria bacterium]|nr:hypothetical protein [Pseudomonadota bacterium]MBU1594629.1 hypothetical protein [Pseudomonadota bacterium]